jgi:hypothetical protein
MLLDIPAAAVARLLLAETLFDRGDVAGALRCLEGASWDASTSTTPLL